jgi:hypothetical protein
VILLGGDDISAGYGYVNRVIPDDQIEGFTHAFARRIAAFDISYRRLLAAENVALTVAGCAQIVQL